MATDDAPILPWPPECEEARRSFAGPGAHLIPLIHGYVHIGCRQAQLLTVLNGSAYVVYQDTRKPGQTPRVERVPVDYVSP